MMCRDFNILFREQCYLKISRFLYVLFKDSHGIEESNAAPVTDTSQDVHVLEGFQNETHTSVTFIRNWQTCDPQDHRLTGDTVRVLWALHQSDPELNTAIWHGDKRGGRALRLRTPSPHAPPQEMQDIRHWDVKLNQFTVSDTMDTVYWCKIFKAPSLTKKHHMVGYTPLVEKANEDLVHHVIVYECASTSPILGQHARIAGAPCYSPTMPREWESCLQPVLAWARGSRGEWLPDHVGIPIAEHQEGSYYMLEVHYNNPGLKKVIDSSGVRIHLTPKLRAQEAGILVAGVAVSPLHLVPPRQKEYATAGYCTPHCTNTMFPEDGVNVVSVVLHSHLAGRRLSLKHIRKGKELPRIVQDNHFDFDYQQSHTLEKEVKILPGDELVAECVYRTLDRTRPTLGGYAASQEMCLAFVVHYPRTPLAACYSMTPVKDLFKTLAVYSFKGVTMDHLEKLFLTTGADPVSLPSTARQQLPVYPATRPSEQIDEDIIREAESALKAMRDYSEERENDNVFARLIIEEPEEFRGRTLAEHILALPWTEELLARSIEKSLYHGRHMTFCRKRDDKLALPANIQTFPNFTALPEQNETVCSELRIASSDSSNISSNFFIMLITVIKRICLYKRSTLGTTSISSSPELRGRTSSEFQHFLLQRDENENLRHRQISNTYRMRRTRHVVLPVRSWQYIGLLLVSLACVTFGLVSRDREGQAGSLTGPELLHRAPHNVDVCPNLNPLVTSSVCLGLSEKQNLALKNNERKEIGSDIVRVERKKSIESCINRNALLEGRHRTMSERRVSECSSYPTNRLSRSLERVDSRTENVRFFYRHSPNSERVRDITDRTRKLSRFSNDRSRSMERREEHRIKRTDGQRTLNNRELKERRERFEVDARRKFDSRGIEKRDIRGRLRENIESRTIRENRNSVRERTQDRRSNSVERQEFRNENIERRLVKERLGNDRRNSRVDTLDRRSNADAERRNSRIDNSNRERRLNVSTERKNSRINTLNRERRLSVSEERRNTRLDNSNRERQLDVSTERRNSRLNTINNHRGSSLSVERRNSRVNTFNREPQSNINAERRISRADTLNRERRLDVNAERRNSRLDTVNSQRGSSLTAERRNSRLDTVNRERRLSAERRNSRADTLNRERRLDVSAERRDSRLDTVNSQRGSSLTAERRNSRLDTVNRERRLSAERRISRADTLNRERRLDVSAERRDSRLDTVNSQRGSSLTAERRNSRLDTVNRERRLSAERRNSRADILNRERRLDVSAERRNSRLDTVNSQRGSSLTAERRNSRLDTVNRERRLSAERRNSRADTLNRERRLDVSAERRDSRLDTVNSQRGSSLTAERRNSRLDTVNRERRLSAERRISRADTLNRERRLDVSAERRDSRLDTVNSQRGSSLTAERRNSRLDTVNRERRLSAERRISRADTLNRERRLDVSAERRDSRLDTVNSQRGSSLTAERRNSRRDTVNRERRLTAERRNSRFDTVISQRRSSRLNAVNRERRLDTSAERRNSRADTLNRERRLDVSAERRNSRLDTVNSQRESSLTAERRNSRLDTVNNQHRLIAERKNSRFDTVNNQRGSSLTAERKNSRLDIFNRERRSNVNAERKNSRLDTSNRERQSNVDAERRNSRLDTFNRERRSSSMTDRTRARMIQENRYDRESTISNSLRTQKSISRDNTPADRDDIRRKDFRSVIRNIRFNSLERQRSGNRLENRRMIDNEDRKLLDRRTRSLDRRNTNTLNRNNRYLGLERRISIDRASEYIDRRDNRREFVNRLSRYPFTDRNSRGEIDRTRTDRSSGSINNNEQRNILLNRRIMETSKLNRREVNTPRRTIRSSNIENLRNSLRYSSDRSLDRTNRIERFSNKRSNEKLTERRSTLGEITDEISFAERRQTQYGQRRISRRLTPEITNRRSFVTREYHVSRQGKRLTRSFDNLNRLNSNERRESVERRFRTDNDRRSSVLSTDRRDTQRQRENLSRTSVLLRTTNLQERRRLNARIQERYNRKIERTIDERRRSSDPSLAGKVERSMELRSRDQRRNVRSNLIATQRNDSQIRYIDSLHRKENVDFDKGFKLIERSRNNADKKSSYRRLVDLRQSNSPREKIRTSETSTYRNTIFVPMIDRDRFDLIRVGTKTRQLFDTNRQTQIIFQEFRNDEYRRKTGMIANLLKTNVFSTNYDSSFEIIRQTFIIIICILYGSSMSKNNKLFTGNLMEGIRKFALW
ncbi:MOXD1 1 [Vespula squamosa]|uniref:MOXD1 1 n=1 Tax=Vespula squamosa TaxID=30214 RepID=A0ABD1ZZ57_VESSQ